MRKEFYRIGLGSDPSVPSVISLVGAEAAGAGSYLVYIERVHLLWKPFRLAFRSFHPQLPAPAPSPSHGHSPFMVMVTPHSADWDCLDCLGESSEIHSFRRRLRIEEAAGGGPAASANFLAKAKLSQSRLLHKFGPRNFFLASKEDRLGSSCMERTFTKRTSEVLPPAQSKQNYGSVKRFSTALISSSSSSQRTFRKALA